MIATLSLALFAAAATGLVVLAAQLFATRRHLAELPPIPLVRRGISILKPLRGVDDGLRANLEHFATLAYPHYELLLGVRDANDPAYPIALEAARRHPERVRVVLQRGRPGLNPKVNQLITLAAEAVHDIVVVSDSNVRTRPGYLDEIAARLDDPGVCLVTHPVVGVDERRLGSRLDHLHLSCAMAPGTIAAKRLLGRDVVIGKSMAMRRRDLRAIGGFEAVKDVLAEDYVLGVTLPARLGKRVVLSPRPIENVSSNRTITDFLARYFRWGVLQRKMVGEGAYAAQLLLNPVFLATIGAALVPELASLVTLACVVAARVAIDALVAASLRPGGFGLWTLLCVPLKDLLAGWAWLQGLARNTVDWRGNRLVVLDGTRLAPAAGVGSPPEAA